MTASTDTPRVWFITGASSGFGLALTEAALEAGDRVVAAARNPDRVSALARRHPDRVSDLAQRHSDRMRTVRLDVTQPDQVRAAIKAGTAAFGRLDVVANIAGYGLFGALEEISEEDLRRQVETNLFGVLNVTRAVLPQLRRQRSGHLVQMSSLSGVAPTAAGEGAYAATKFAVEGFSEVLAKEVAHLGINVTIVEPGPFRTDFGTGSSITAVRDADYDPSVGESLRWFEQMAGTQSNDPARGARAIIAAVAAHDPPLRLPLGPEALSAIRDKLSAHARELDAWEHLSNSTQFAGQ